MNNNNPMRRADSEPDWQRLVVDVEFEQFWESTPIERAITGSLEVLLDPTKTDLASIQYARGRLAVIFELRTLPARMAAREVPQHEVPPESPKKGWLRDLLDRVGVILGSERGGAWPSPAVDMSVSSLATQDDAS